MNQSGSEIGKQIIIIGIIVIGIGVIILFKDQFPWLKKIGHLPGDINIKGENFSFYFPLATSLLVSLLLSLIFYFIKK